MHTKQGVKEICLEIFRQIFSDNKLKISEETSAADVASWDSLAQVQILMSLEISFGIQFSMDEVEDLQNVGEIIDLILLKTNN